MITNKTDFPGVITPVFSVTWSFINFLFIYECNETVLKYNFLGNNGKKYQFNASLMNKRILKIYINV